MGLLHSLPGQRHWCTTLLLLYYWFTAGLLLLYICGAAAFPARPMPLVYLLLLYYCFTTALLLLYCCFTAALLLLWLSLRPLPGRLHGYVLS